MDEYYLQQAGSGMGAFAGMRYQKGNGFFGRLISGTVLPMIKKVLPFLGKTAMSSGIDVMNDWSQGDNFGNSFKKRMKETGEKITDTAMTKVKELTGSGKRKRGKRSKKLPLIKQQRKGKRRVTKKSKTKAKSKRRTRKAADFL